MIGIFSPTDNLSATYGSGEHRAHAGDRITYRPVHRRNVKCDECFALQHESDGRVRPQHRAAARRIIRGGPDLYLCAGHTEQWRHRDAEDVKGRAS